MAGSVILLFFLVFVFSFFFFFALFPYSLEYSAMRKVYNFLPALTTHVHCALDYEVEKQTLRRRCVVGIRLGVHSESFGSCRVHHSI